MPGPPLNGQIEGQTWAERPAMVSRTSHVVAVPATREEAFVWSPATVGLCSAGLRAATVVTMVSRAARLSTRLCAAILEARVWSPAPQCEQRRRRAATLGAEIDGETDIQTDGRIDG